MELFPPSSSFSRSGQCFVQTWARPSRFERTELGPGTQPKAVLLMMFTILFILLFNYFDIHVLCSLCSSLACIYEIATKSRKPVSSLTIRHYFCGIDELLMHLSPSLPFSSRLF